jgi:hypothetical protein
MVTPVEAASDRRLVLVGASHMCRTAQFLSNECISLAYPGFRPEKEKISGIVKNLEKLDLGPNDKIVLDLLLNSAFMGTDDNRLPTPALRAGDGSYHIPNNTEKASWGLRPLVSIIGKRPVLLVVPIHRYVIGKCCSDPAHI